MPTKTVTDATFATDVIGADRPVLVDFWADWCGPCKMIAPSLEQLADEYGDALTIAKVDIMENPETPGRFGVQGIPALLLFRNGELVDQLAGAMPKSQLKAWIDQRL